MKLEEENWGKQGKTILVLLRNQTVCPRCGQHLVDGEKGILRLQQQVGATGASQPNIEGIKYELEKLRKINLEQLPLKRS